MMNNIDVNALAEEYAIDDDIFSSEDIKITRLKYIINQLPNADKIIILMYAECQSVRKLAKILGLSHSTIYKEIKRIQKIIKDKMAKYDNN